MTGSPNKTQGGPGPPLRTYRFAFAPATFQFRPPELNAAPGEASMCQDFVSSHVGFEAAHADADGPGQGRVLSHYLAQLAGMWKGRRRWKWGSNSTPPAVAAFTHASLSATPAGRGGCVRTQAASVTLADDHTSFTSTSHTVVILFSVSF
jgi:hypothetical protein